MYLTPENASDYLGKELNASKSIFHYYPIKEVKSYKVISNGNM